MRVLPFRSLLGGFAGSNPILGAQPVLGSPEPEVCAGEAARLRLEPDRDGWRDWGEVPGAEPAGERPRSDILTADAS